MGSRMKPLLPGTSANSYPEMDLQKHFPLPTSASWKRRSGRTSPIKRERSRFDDSWRRASMPVRSATCSSVFRGIPRPVSARRLPLPPRPATLRPRLGLPVPPLERSTLFSNSADKEGKLCLVNVDELNHAIQQAVQQQVVVQMQVLKPTLAGLAALTATDTEPTPLKMSGYEVLMDPGQN